MTAFQAPDTGLIAMLDQAGTSEKLRDCFSYLIGVLFSRDGDEEIRQSYHAIMRETFEGADSENALAGQKTKLRMVMTRVMNDRIKLAREYAASKDVEGGTDARRAGEAAPKVETT